jgi:putative endonuclease
VKYPEFIEGQNMKNWFVYIAKAGSGRYYTGITTDPEARIESHNTGKGARLAKQQGNFSLVYLPNPFPGKSPARKREAQIKRWTREKKEKIINGEWL